MKTITPRKTGVSRYLTLLFTQLLCIVWILSSVSYAQPTGLPTSFNGNPDGWQFILPESDEPTVYGSTFLRDEVNSSVDDQLAQQAKDVNDISMWHWNLGNTNDKTDITNVGAAIVTDAGSGDTYLIFFGDRLAPNGDANIGFWLLLNGTTITCDDPNNCTEGMFAPGHNDGDLLVLSNFLNGGGFPDVKVHQWDNGALTDVTGSVPHGAAVNDQDYPVPQVWDPDISDWVPYESPDGDIWTFQAKNGVLDNYEAGLFFEGYINLTDIVDNEALCNAQVLFETRNSQRLTAQLGDFVSGGFNLIPDPPGMTPDAKCLQDGGVTLNLCVTEPKINMVYDWYTEASLTNKVHTGECYTTPALTAPGDYTYWVTATNLECTGLPATVIGTVYPLPPCGITGDLEVCPNTTNIQYTGPSAAEGVTTWEWSISGNGTITSITDNVILVDAYGGCDESFELELTTYNVHGCTCTSTLEVFVGDRAAPTFSVCPSDVSVECYAVPAPATLTATDNCDGAVPVSFSEVRTDGSCPNNYTLTRTWTATDNCGNDATCVQIVTVSDNTPPVLTGCPSDASVECDAVPDPVTVTALDNCDGVVPVSFTEDRTDGSCPDSYTLTRTWTATDNCGNSASCVQIINVSDNTPPVLSGCPGDIAVECDAVPDPATVTATDNCDEDVPVTFNEERTDGYCPDTYTLTRTWTATDDCGNSSSCTQIVSVSDNTPPVLSGCPDDVSVECDAVPLPATVTATDNCDDDVPVTFSEVRTDGYCPDTYTLTRTWTATDDCGNSSSCAQTINVSDNTPPELHGCPANVSVECDAVPAPAVVTATDNCDDDVPVTFNEVRIDGPCPDTYTLTRTWTATDDCGNSSSCSQTIEVSDNTPPELHGCPDDVTVECDAVPAPAAVTATDNCDDDVPVSYNEVRTDGPCPDTYTLTRTWTATDDCDNSSSCTQVINVEDNTPPTITCPADVTVECDESTDPSNTGSATATDNCDSDPTIGYSDNVIEGSCADSWTIERTWTATDNCNNSSSCMQIITVVDNTPPEITCPPDVTVQCDESTDPANTGSATATDNCDADPTITYNDNVIVGDCFHTRTIERTWTATDNCSNSASCMQIISVEDNVDPTLSNVPDDVIIGCVEPFEFDDPTVSDNCDQDPTLHWTRSDGRALHDTYFEPGTVVTICFWGEDCAGNTSEVECFTVTVEICGLCFYTKGFYGNEGGLGWMVDDCSIQFTALDMMQAALASSGNVYEFGDPGVRSFKLLDTDLTQGGNIFNMLPGGGTPAVLLDNYVATYVPDDYWWIVPLDENPDNYGWILNNLLAQTMTFYFNMQNNPDAWDHFIGGNVLVTKESDCDFTMTSGEPESFPIPQTVIDELNGNYTDGATLGNLLQLANDVLGNINSNVTPADVTAALDAFNKGFDECRAFVAYQNLQSAPAPGGDNTITTAVESKEVEVKAYPNPFRGDVTIEFTVPQTTNVTLEIYTLEGRKVETLFSGMAEKDAIHTYQFDGKGMANQSVFIYVIKTQFGTSMGKLIRLK